MISKQEIESIAAELTTVGFEPTNENMLALLGKLNFAELGAVKARARELHDIQVAEMQSESTSLENLLRLGAAAGCPKSEAALPWLAGRGLAVEVDGVWHFNTAKPKAVT
jgi:hypothetical protein